MRTSLLIAGCAALAGFALLKSQQTAATGPRFTPEELAANAAANAARVDYYAAHPELAPAGPAEGPMTEDDWLRSEQTFLDGSTLVGANSTGFVTPST